MHNSVKGGLTDFIYVLIWSVGLLYASFPGVFDGTYNYIICHLSLEDAVSCYVFPAIMAMLLFLFDVIYNIISKNVEGKNSNYPLIFICFSVFLICFLLPLLYDNMRLVKWSFRGLWFTLAFMKLVSLKPKTSTLPVVSEPDCN